MKKRLLPLTIASLFALSQPAMSQDSAATPTPATSPTPTASPSPTATPAADSSSGASTASPDEIKAAEAKTAPSPTASPEQPSPTPDAVLPEAGPSPSPAANQDTTDADFLPEPTDASLGAPVETAEPLPTSGPADDLPNPDSLIPPGVSGADDAPPAPPVAVENKFEKDRKLQVRYQEVKLQALKDPAVRSLTEQAEASKTDEGKRQALREYYRLLFAKMISIDGDLKIKCETMQDAYLRRLGQYRVSPSIPLNPPPTPEPLAN